MGYQPQYPNNPDPNGFQQQGGYPPNTQYPPYANAGTPYGNPYDQQPYGQQPYPMPPQQPYMQQQPYPPGYAAPQPGGGLAIAGLVLGIVGIMLWWIPVFGLLPPIAGIVLSAMGNKPFSPRRGLAIAGLVLSIIALVIGIFYIIGLISNASHY